MKVAVAQFASGYDKSANLARIGELVRAARADLVVLPEGAMHTFGKPTDRLLEAAEPLDGPFVTGLSALAAETGATVLAGMFEEVPDRAAERVYNTVVAVGAQGLLGRYRKVHLFDAFGWRESDRLRPGDPGDLLTVPVGDLVVGVVTCYDVRFPEITRALVDAGATLLAVPSAWVGGPMKEEVWLTLARARAIENTCWLAGAGQVPPEFVGRSVVVDPLGVPVAQLGADEGVAVAEVDVARVADVRGRLPCLHHRRYAVTPAASPPSADSGRAS